MARGFSTALLLGASFLLLISSGGNAWAGACLDHGCHHSLTTRRYLHGPVAAEMAGAKGCIACHHPTSVACTPTKAGTFDSPAQGMCKLCHAHETDTEHTKTYGHCLDCHAPHGSQTSPYLLRTAK